MEINWFTVIAQLINFFILVWLLKRFLYQPVLDAIATRESKIEVELKDAKDKKALALKEQNDFQERNAAFDLDKQTRTEKMTAELSLEREKLLEDARTAAESLAKDIKLRAEQQSADDQHQAGKKIKEEVLAITRKVLTDLASIAVEDIVVKAFIDRLQGSGTEELTGFKKAFENSEEPLLISSAFELNSAQKERVTSVIKAILGSTVAVTFKQNSSLVAGIEISSKTYKISWNISEYLRAFDEEISAISDKKESKTSKKSK